MQLKVALCSSTLTNSVRTVAVSEINFSNFIIDNTISDFQVKFLEMDYF